MSVSEVDDLLEIVQHLVIVCARARIPFDVTLNKINDNGNYKRFTSFRIYAIQIP